MSAIATISSDNAAAGGCAGDIQSGEPYRLTPSAAAVLGPTSPSGTR